MANLTYEERVALEQEKERLRRQRDDERRNGMSATRANDSRIVGNDNAMHGQAGRKWLGGESGSVSNGDAMHGKAGRKWLGVGGGDVQEPRSRISFFASDGKGRISRGDNSSGQMVIRDTNANGSDWGSVVVEDRAKKAADSVRQMLAEVDNADKQRRQNGEANDNILGGLAYAAMNMPFESDGNGGYAPRELTPETIRRIVGDNADWQGVSRVFMRKTKVGDSEIPLLWMEKDGKMQYFSPDQAGYAANLYTGGIAAANKALNGGGSRGVGGGTASPWTSGMKQNGVKGNSRDRVMLTAIQAALKEYDGDEAAQEQYVSRMMAMYDKFAKGEAAGEGEPTATPQGLTDEERKAGVVIGSDGKKYANAKDMPKGVTVNMNPNAQPKPTNRNGVVDGMMGKRKPNAAPTVDEVAGSARFTGPQDVIEFERNGQVVKSAGWVGKDGKFYDSTGREIAGAKPVSEEAKKRLAKSDAFKRERAEFRRNALEERGFSKDEIAYLERNPQLVQKLIDEDNAAFGMAVPKAPTPNAQVAAKENKADEMLAEKKRREAAGKQKQSQKPTASTGGGQEKPKKPTGSEVIERKRKSMSAADRFGQDVVDRFKGMGKNGSITDDEINSGKHDAMLEKVGRALHGGGFKSRNQQMLENSKNLAAKERRDALMKESAWKEAERMASYDESDRKVVEKAKSLFGSEWKAAEDWAIEHQDEGVLFKDDFETARQKKFKELVEKKADRDGIQLFNIYKSGQNVFGGYNLGDVFDHAFGKGAGARFASHKDLQSRRIGEHRKNK